VDDGKVEFENLAGKTVIVESGHYAVAAQNVMLVTRLSRVSSGLAALYTFKEGRGGVVHDVSHAGTLLDLKIDNEKAVRWSPKGLLLNSSTLLVSAGPATRLIQACKASNEVTLEVWARPGTLTQSMKDSRILVLSADTGNQNFILGQEAVEGPLRSYFVRFRTTQTDNVGKPVLASQADTASLKLAHVVYTRAASGVATIYIDGTEDTKGTAGGTLDPWDDGYRIAIGNEMTKDRPWLGEVQLAAVYSRALSADDVRQNHRAGLE
jgi:hypothetical protein